MLDVTGVYLPLLWHSLVSPWMLLDTSPQLQEDVLNRDDGADVATPNWWLNYILDVGHNSLACEFVTRSLSPVIPSRDELSFGALGDKDIDSMLPILRAYMGALRWSELKDRGDGKSTRSRRRGRYFLDRRIGGVLLRTCAMRASF